MTYGMILSEATVCAVAFFVERGIFMARKSRKHQHAEMVKTSIAKAVGYVRLSVANQEESSSIQNQKFIIECWGDQHQIPISNYYIDNGFSGKRFDRPAFQKMSKDILTGKINCVIVKDLSRLGRDYITTGYYIEVIFPANGVRFVSVNDTGMLVQGKEKRAVAATHEPLVDTDTFDAIQRSFQAKAFNLTTNSQSTENVLKGKVICGCCGGKMQRKRGTNHADWYFFTCITKNRLGAGKCTGMYVREEDVFSAVYYQLKLYINYHFITKDQYKQEIQHLDSTIEAASIKYGEATDFSMKLYEKYVMGEGSKEAIAAARPAKEQAEVELNRAIANKVAYEEQYRVFCKLLKASRKEVPLNEIVDCIEQIVVDVDGRIMVKWTK